MDVEHLHQGAARPRQRHREHPVAAEAPRQRLALDRHGNLRQVAFAEDAAVGHHVLMDQPGGLTRVEVLAAPLGQAAKGRGQRGLDEPRPGPARPAPVLQEQRSGRVGLQVPAFSPGEAVLQHADLVPVGGQFDGRLEDRRPAEAPEALQHVGIGRGRAGDGGGHMPAPAVGSQVGEAVDHSPAGGSRRPVHRHRGAGGPVMDEHHGLAAQSRRGGLAHAEGQRGRHRGVNCVAAPLQHPHPGGRGRVVGRAHHPVRGRGDPLGLVDAGVGQLQQVGVHLGHPPRLPRPRMAATLRLDRRARLLGLGSGHRVSARSSR